MKKNSIDWDLYAKGYDLIVSKEINPAYEELKQRVVQFFSTGVIRHGDVVVDFGGGTGNFSIPLAEKYPKSQFWIFDISEEMIAVAKEKIKLLGLKNINTCVCDLENIDVVCDSLGIEQINHAVLIHSLYATKKHKHDDTHLTVLSKISNLTVPGGTLFLSDINRVIDFKDWFIYMLKNMLKNIHSPARWYQIYNLTKDSQHINRMAQKKQMDDVFLICDLEELKEMVYGAGFKYILSSTDQLYRGIDNTIMAIK